MKVHHIGYLVKSIDESIGYFLDLGFEISKTKSFDEIRNINICFLVKDGLCIELIEGINEMSVVYKLYEKYKNVAYHICYESNDISKDIKTLESKGYTTVSDIEAAPCIENKKVVFLYNRNIGFIELVEEG